MSKPTKQRLMINIDGEALKNAFRVRNLSYAEVARNIGYTTSYFSQCANKGEISMTAMVVLKAMYNITEDEIAPKVEKVEVAEEKHAETRETYSDLYDVIFKAVTDAFEWYANGGRNKA